jgi:hypothetical protein
MMRKDTSPVRLNIYLPDQATRRRIKVIATERNLTLSHFCLQAIQAQLSQADNEKQRISLSKAVDRARKFHKLIGLGEELSFPRAFKGVRGIETDASQAEPPLWLILPHRRISNAFDH